MKVVEKIIKKAEMGRAPSEIATMWRATSLQWVAFVLLQVFTLTAFAANPPASSITINGNQELQYNYPYLLNNGTRSATGSLGSTAVAHFDYQTGILTLQGYSGGEISVNGPRACDLTVKLIGNNNTITVNAAGRQAFGINSGSGGDITITSAAAATLTINVTSSGYDAIGIVTGFSTSITTGNVTLDGMANVTVNATSTAPASAYKSANGIFATENCSILGNASFTAICNSNSTTSGLANVAGIYKSVQQSGATIINTTGDITLDVSQYTGGVSHNPLNSPLTTLTKVNLMTLKWGAGGSPNNGTITYNTANFNVVQNNTTRMKTFRWGAPLTFTDNVAYDVPSGLVNTAIASINVSGGATGGYGTKTFSKVSGPAWLNVSSAGVISGTRPASGQSATTAVVRVTDADGAAADITIDIGAVTGANPAVTSVTVNGNVVLNSTTPYLVNGAAASSGTLNGTTCTAQFTASAGTLALYNYNGSNIDCFSNSNTIQDLTITLQGINTITATYQYGGLRYNAGGNFIIKSYNTTTAATLNIKTNYTGGSAYGINLETNASIGSSTKCTMTVTDQATVNVEVTGATSGQRITGINDGYVEVLGSASLTATVSGGTSTLLPVYAPITINTTGNVTAEIGSAGNSSSFCFSNGTVRLNNVGTLTMKWGSGASVPISANDIVYDANAFIVYNDNATRTRTYRPGVALSFTHKFAFDVPEEYVSTALSPTINVSSGASGGTTPYTFSLQSGPSWLTVSSAGVISGTRPSSSVAATTATIRATDAGGNTKDIVINIGAIKYRPVTIGINSAWDVLPGEVGTSVWQSVDFTGSVSGGSGSYRATMEASASPDWLDLYNMVLSNYYSGTRPNTPQAATTALIKIWDYNDADNAVWVTVNVGAVVVPLTYNSTALPGYYVPAGTYNTAITPIDLKPLISGGVPPYTFTTPSVHEWVNLSANGILTGTRPGTNKNSTSIVVEVHQSGSSRTEWFYIQVGAVTAPTAKLGDINGDGDVNAADLSILLANFGKSGAAITNPAADLNKDGDVNAADLSILLANFGK